MALIRNNEVETSQQIRLVVHALDACHDDRLLGVPGFQSGGVDSDGDFRAELPDFVGVLFKELLHVSEDEHSTVPQRHGVFRDLSDYQRLTRTRGENNAGKTRRVLTYGRYARQPKEQRRQVTGLVKAMSQKQVLPLPPNNYERYP